MIRTQGIQNRRTPREVFEALDREFGFAVDAAADSENAHCPAYYTEADDALRIGRWASPAFLNPPFSQGTYGVEKGMGAWLLKAREQADMGVTVVVMAPGDWSPKWFHNHVWSRAREIRLVYPRIHYPRPDKAGRGGPSGPSFVLVYRPGPEGHSLVVPWTWRDAA